jgi:hypothetical protein
LYIYLPALVLPRDPHAPGLAAAPAGWAAAAPAMMLPKLLLAPLLAAGASAAPTVSFGVPHLVGSSNSSKPDGSAFWVRVSTFTQPATHQRLPCRCAGHQTRPTHH